MWHQKAKGPPDGPPIFLIFVEKLNCPQSQAYQSISPVGTGLSLTDRALGVSLGTSIGNYSPLIAPQPVKLKIHRWRQRAGSSPATGTKKDPHPQRGCGSFLALMIPTSEQRFDARPQAGVSERNRRSRRHLARRRRPPAPRRSKLYIACSDFLQKSERAHAAAPPFQIESAMLGFDLGLVQT